ncbi:hypothetical protein AB1Y20_007053 [Prymnesium parvum]|uniref:EamA domain-containing protein n=1 Tax=Prymnesium parvum TaxID=97485 RepID=A0AB34J032_PRYPA
MDAMRGRSKAAGLAAPLLDLEPHEREWPAASGVALPPPAGCPSASPAPPPPRPLPLLCVAVASLLFGLVSALLKYVGLPPLLMMQARSLIQWVLSLLVCGWRYATRRSPSPAALLLGPPPLRHLLFTRALLFWAFMLLWWTSLTALPVGDATSLVFCWPVLTACWSITLLREQVRPHFWPCLAFNLLGLLLVSRPSFLFGRPTNRPATALHPVLGVVAALAAATVGSILPVIVRKSRACHWTTVEHVTTSLASFAFTPACLALWFGAIDPTAFSRTRASLTAGWGATDAWQPRPWGLSVLLAAALIGFGALGLQTYGYQNERTTRASMMSFVEIPFAYLLQLVMFDDKPDPCALVGVACILGSGLATVLFEHRHLLPTASPITDGSYSAP